jgi:hypothetical protein
VAPDRSIRSIPNWFHWILGRWTRFGGLCQRTAGTPIPILFGEPAGCSSRSSPNHLGKCSFMVTSLHLTGCDTFISINLSVLSISSSSCQVLSLSQLTQPLQLAATLKEEASFPHNIPPCIPLRASFDSGRNCRLHPELSLRDRRHLCRRPHAARGRRNGCRGRSAEAAASERAAAPSALPGQTKPHASSLLPVGRADKRSARWERVSHPWQHSWVDAS